jgi:RES domain-containing protein
MKWFGGRFNYGVDIDSARFAAFPALYLAESFETGLREMQGLTREDNRDGLSASELNLCAEHGVAWVPIKGTVSNIFDLTKVSNLDGFASRSRRIISMEPLSPPASMGTTTPFSRP